MRPEYIIITIHVWATFMVFWLVCIIVMGWKFYCSQIRQTIAVLPILKHTTMSYLIFYFIACNIDSIWLLLIGLSDFELLDDLKFDNAMITIYAVSFCIGYVSFYTFLILRVYYIFKESIFAITLRTLIIYIGSTTLGGISCFVVFMLYVFGIEYEPNHDISDTIYLSVLIITFCTTFMVSISLIYTTSSRLIKMVLLQYNADRTNLNASQQQLIYVATKQFLLGSMALVAFYIAIPLSATFFIHYEHNFYTFLGKIFCQYILQAIEIICILLTFPFNEKYYNCCCKSCHKLCIICCTKYTEKLMDKADDTDSELELLQPDHDPDGT